MGELSKAAKGGEKFGAYAWKRKSVAPQTDGVYVQRSLIIDDGINNPTVVYNSFADAINQINGLRYTNGDYVGYWLYESSTQASKIVGYPYSNYRTASVSIYTATLTTIGAVVSDNSSEYPKSDGYTYEAITL